MSRDTATQDITPKKDTGLIKAVMWKPGGRNASRKHGHLPLGTLLLGPVTWEFAHRSSRNNWLKRNHKAEKGPTGCNYLGSA